MYATHCLKFYSKRVSRRTFLLHNSMACKRSNISSFVSQVSRVATGIFKLATLYVNLLVSSGTPTILNVLFAEKCDYGENVKQCATIHPVQVHFKSTKMLNYIMRSFNGVLKSLKLLKVYTIRH